MLLCCTGSTTTHSRMTRSGRIGGRTILHLGGHILAPVRPATQPCQSSFARSAARRWQPARCGHSQRRVTLSLSPYSCCFVVRLAAGLYAVAFLSCTIETCVWHRLPSLPSPMHCRTQRSAPAAAHRCLSCAQLGHCLTMSPFPRP
jgi:hypothetical protein